VGSAMLSKRRILNHRGHPWRPGKARECAWSAPPRRLRPRLRRVCVTSWRHVSPAVSHHRSVENGDPRRTDLWAKA